MMLVEGAMKSIIKVECSSCGATGLYSGFMEAKGTAVVCDRCDGSGCETIWYTLFTKRRPRRGIAKVYQSRKSFFGVPGKPISYTAFARGKMP